MPDSDEILYVFYVNEEKLNSCPRVPICIGNQHIPAVIDTGSQISLLTEDLYYKLRSEGVEGLEVGVQNAVLVSAFGNKTKCMRVQAMMPILIDDIVVDHIFLISPQLLTQALLGVDFCRMNNIIINFPEQCFTMERDGNVSRHHFAYDNNIHSISIGDLGPADNSTKADIESMQIAANSMTTGQLLITPHTIYEAERSVKSMWFHVATPRTIIKDVRLANEPAVIMIIV